MAHRQFFYHLSRKELKKKIKLNVLKDAESKTFSGERVINVLPAKLNVKNIPGKLNPNNSEYVINTIKNILFS